MALLLQRLSVRLRVPRHGWARLRGTTHETRHYANDLAFVPDLNALDYLTVWVVPRLGWDDTRPPQTKPVNSFARQYKPTSYTDSLPKGALLDDEGYIGFQLHDRASFRLVDVVPGPNELAAFERCSAMTRSIFEATLEEINSISLQLEDRVTITDGLFQGLIGRIIERSPSTCQVYIASQDHVEEVCNEHVRKTFRPGDEVQISFNGKVFLAWVMFFQEGSELAHSSSIQRQNSNYSDRSIVEYVRIDDLTEQVRNYTWLHCAFTKVGNLGQCSYCARQLS